MMASKGSAGGSAGGVGGEIRRNSTPGTAVGGAVAVRQGSAEGAQAMSRPTNIAALPPMRAPTLHLAPAPALTQEGGAEVTTHVGLGQGRGVTAHPAAALLEVGVGLAELSGAHLSGVPSHFHMPSHLLMVGGQFGYKSQ